MATKYVRVIGQAPSSKTDGQGAFTGRSGAFLALLAGCSQEEFLRVFDVVNLLDHYPGKREGKGDKFPMAEARKAAAACSLTGRTIFVGRQVAKAFGAKENRFFEFWEHQPNVMAVIVPHPSKVSTWWNDPAKLEQARKFWAAQYQMLIETEHQEKSDGRRKV